MTSYTSPFTYSGEYPEHWDRLAKANTQCNRTSEPSDLAQLCIVAGQCTTVQKSVVARRVVATGIMGTSALTRRN